MCLAVPMQVEAVDGLQAVCNNRGVRREVNLFLLQDQPPRVGDFVLVHVGYAIKKVAADEAREAWQLMEQMQPGQADA